MQPYNVCNAEILYMDAIYRLKLVLALNTSAVSGGEEEEVLCIAEEMLPEISQDNILFKDEDTCILSPEYDGGVLIRHSYPAEVTEKVNADGLIAGKLTDSTLKPYYSQKDDKYHRPIYFRAPYNNSPCQDIVKNWNNPEYLFGKLYEHQNVVYIRVDPMQTYVYSDTIASAVTRRASYFNLMSPTVAYQNSRMLLGDYMKRLTTFQKKMSNLRNIPMLKKEGVYIHAFDGNIHNFPEPQPYPWIKLDDVDCQWNRRHEILVNLPNVPPEWFAHGVVDVD